MKKLFFTFLFLIVGLMVWADNSVAVTFNGNTATVTVDDNVAQYITVTQSGAHVSITQSDDVAEEITYTLSGTSNDGEFYMSGSFKATVELNGLTLTNTNPVYSGAAINVQNSKRINVKVITGTTNTLADAWNGTQKGCLYVKGHAEFKQYGTLNVVGNKSHAIKAGEYISIKNATINVTSAVDDGISCNQYFLMESGTVNISGTGDDGIQCDLDGTTSTGMTPNHDEEDSGNVYISGGNISINCSAAAAKGIKNVGDVYISSDPTIDITTTGHGKWDSTDGKAVSACCLSADGNIDISGGTITLTATGSGGKGMKCDNVMTISGGTITVTTLGGLYYNNGTTENLNYTANTDHINDLYYASAKGIKAGDKTTSGSTTNYSGGLVISGGTISVSTSGNNAEGIESKNTINITGGYITVEAYDDGINAAQDMNVNGGYIYSHSNNNDGMDANGNFYIYDGLVYAIGSSQPELALDANTEGGKKLYIYGGTLITIGGLESGCQLSQTCYSSSSWTTNKWYSMTFGSTVIAFKTPSNGGNTLVVSAASTPTVKSNVTVNGGTSIFDGRCYLDATVSGGSNVTLSQYTGGGGGGNPPGPGGNTYTITATASPTAGGTVTGAGSYNRYATCTLTATPNTGYSFVRWTRNGSQVSTNPTYSFTVTSNAGFVAVFNQNSYTVTATASPAAGGTVSGGGTYNHGSTCTLTATPRTGYIFVRWTRNGSQVSTNPTYSFSVTENSSYVAEFVVGSFDISVSANPAEGGTVSGGGTYNNGSVCTLTAIANTGYSFVRWTKNNVQVSTDPTYSFTVTANASYVAEFSLNSYIVNATANSIEGGSVAISGDYNISELHYDFEDGTSQGWTILQGPDSDSPHNWMHCVNYTAYSLSSGYGHNASNGFILSESLINNSYGVHPDNYLVSPQVLLGGSVNFWATNLDDEFGAEHFAVAVSTNGNTDVNDFTTIEEWTLPVVRTGETRNVFDDVWYEYTVDLSAYSGMGYIAIRHFDCYEQWLFCVDDITIVEGLSFDFGESCTVVATANDGYSFVNWTIDGNEVSTEAAYSFNVTEDVSLVANFVVSNVTQTIYLSSGFNWVSVCVDITLEDLESAITNALSGCSGMMISSQGDGYTQYNGRIWRGGLNTLDVTQMYIIELPETCEITLTGAPVNPAEHPVTIRKGNNWIAYPLNTTMSVKSVFADFPLSGDRVSSQSKYAQYNGTIWRGGLNFLDAGNGYIYTSTAEEDRILIFPSNGK